MDKKSMDKKNEIILKTRNACVDLLTSKRKAFLIRDTGFGKTWIMSDLIESKIWKKIIYIYPLDSIKSDFINKYSHKLEGIDVKCISYTSLALADTLSSSADIVDVLPDLVGMENGLFIFDEAHRLGIVGEDRIGVNKSSNFVEKILKYYPNAYYFGATATPIRTDRANMIDTIFDGRLVFPYTMKDAIRDGLFEKPRYVFSTYDIKTLSNELSKNIETQSVLSKEDKIIEIEKLTNTVIHYSKILNMPSILKRNIEATNCRKDYMKFIVFFSNTEVLFDVYEKVISWFKEAFPNMKVRYTIVISKDSEYKKNFDKVSRLEDEEGIIDLVFNINMITMGYHDKNITGVMMLRFTSSDIIYNQAIGRTFNMESSYQGVIFDIVGNYVVDEEGNITSKRLLGNKETNSDYKYSKYVSVIDESVVVMSDDIKDIEEVIRLSNYNRIQHEEEIVKMYKRGIFNKEICSSELGIDVASFDRLLERYSYVRED